MNASKRLVDRALRLGLILLVLFTALAPLEAVAMTDPADPDSVQFLLDNYRCPANITGITNRAVECVRTLLDSFSATSFALVLSKLSKAVAAVMIIYVAFTGIRMVMSDVRDMKSETFMLFVKLTFVAFLTTLASNWYTPGARQQIMAREGLTQAQFDGKKSGLYVMYDFTNDLSQGLVNGVTNNFTNVAGPCNVGSIWERTDCLILGFLGQQLIPGTEGQPFQNRVRKAYIDTDCNGTIDPGEMTEDNQMLDVVLFSFASSQLFTPHGIFMLVLIAVASLMLAYCFAVGVFVFIISMVALTFLFMIGPLFIPLFLFQRTKRMFFTWAIQIVNYMIQPALMVGFLSFLLAVLNITIYGEGTPGSKGLEGTMQIIQAEMTKNQCTQKTLVHTSNAVMSDIADRALNADRTIVRAAGQQAQAVAVPYTPIPYKLLSIFIVQILSCIVLLYIMVALMQNVGDIAGQLSAGTGGTLSRYMPGAGKASGMANDFARGAVKQ